MIKLSKAQTEALAKRITEELNKEINIHNSKIRDQIEEILLEDEDYKALLKIQQNNSDGSYGYSHVISAIRLRIKKEHTELQEKRSLNVSDITSSLIYNTIDCSDLDALIKKVKEEWEEKS